MNKKTFLKTRGPPPADGLLSILNHPLDIALLNPIFAFGILDYNNMMIVSQEVHVCIKLYVTCLLWCGNSQSYRTLSDKPR